MKTEDRLRILEQELRRLRELADHAPEREARAGRVRNPRLAKTFHQDGVAYPTAPATVYPIVFLDSTYTETPGDQTPTDTARQAHAGAVAYYGGADYLEEETVVCVHWDNERWWILGSPGAGGQILWAVIQSGTNDTAQLSRIFSAKACDYQGGNITGDAFDLDTPALGAVTKCTKDTALFPGYVVGYQVQPDGAAVIVTDIYDVPIGSIELTTDPWGVGPRDGWIDAAAAYGRYLLGAYAGEGEPPMGIEAGPGSGPPWDGGSLHHGGPCGYGHGVHALATNAYNGEGIQIFPFSGATAEQAAASASHLEAEHTPPYVTYRVLKRTR